MKLIFHFLYYFSRQEDSLALQPTGDEQVQRWTEIMSESQWLCRVSLFSYFVCFSLLLSCAGVCETSSIKLFVEKLFTWSFFFSPPSLFALHPSVASQRLDENIYERRGNNSTLLQFFGYLLVLFHYSRANRVLSSLCEFISIPFSIQTPRPNPPPTLKRGEQGELLCMLIDVKIKTCSLPEPNEIPCFLRRPRHSVWRLIIIIICYAKRTWKLINSGSGRIGVAWLML